VLKVKGLTQKEILKGLSCLIENDLRQMENKTNLNNRLNYYFYLNNKEYQVKLIIESV
jgi:hypothetical protein